MNIQPFGPNGTGDIDTALTPGLIMSDWRTAEVVGRVAQDMRIITAPKHPGRDPVSVHIVQQFVSVLRGEGGLASRMAGVADRLHENARRLEASLHGYNTMDQNAADTISRIDPEQRR